MKTTLLFAPVAAVIISVSFAACGPEDGSSGTGGGSGGAGSGGGSAATGGGSAGGGEGGGAVATGGGSGGGGAGGGTVATGGGSGGGGGTGGGAAFPRFAADIAPILKAKCGNCHGSQYAQAGTAYTRLRGTTSGTTACASTPRIIVNDGANSLVVKKMLGTAGCGARMPIVNMAGCTGNACVPATDIDKIKVWIDNGALNN